MDRYLRQNLPEPSIGDWETPPPEQARGLSVESPRVHLQGEQLRSCQAGYYGLINHLDDQIHRLIAARGQRAYPRNNTIIVYTSDRQ